MKKLFIAILGVAAFAACSQEMTLETPKGAAIGFDNVFVENATRAADLTANNITDFGDYGFISNAAGKGQIFNNQAVTKSGDAFTYSPAQYWVANADYYFAAIVPYAGAHWTYAADKETPDAGLLSFNNSAAAANQDLLFAYYKRDAVEKIEAAPAPVAFTFDHVLSRVKFSFKNGFAEGQNITLDVTNVNITNAIAEGTLALEAGALAADWVVAATPATFNIPFGNAGATLAATAVGTTEHFYLIPANDYEYNVTFDITLYQAGVKLDTYNRSAKVTVDLLRGNSYELAATLNASNVSDENGENALYPIEFAINKVNEWVENYADVIVPSHNVATEAELNAALAKGGTILLTEDITLTAPLYFSYGKNIEATIDLGGHDITAKYGNSSVYAILAYGGNLTIKGNGKIDSYQTAVCSYGSTVNIENGDYVGGYDGSATIYAYTGTINISGGTFKAETMSTLMNQYSVLNCYDKKGAVISVSGGSFYKFDPSANASEGKNTNFVATGKTVEQNGDWYIVK